MLNEKSERKDKLCTKGETLFHAGTPTKAREIWKSAHFKAKRDREGLGSGLTEEDYA